MEIKIGVRGVAREITLDSNLNSEEIVARLNEATAANSSLTLEDDRGRTYVIPSKAIGYLEIGSTEARRVGFGI